MNKTLRWTTLLFIAILKIWCPDPGNVQVCMKFGIIGTWNCWLRLRSAATDGTWIYPWNLPRWMFIWEWNIHNCYHMGCYTSLQPGFMEFIGIIRHWFLLFCCKIVGIGIWKQLQSTYIFSRLIFWINQISSDNCCIRIIICSWDIGTWNGNWKLELLQRMDVRGSSQRSLERCMSTRSPSEQLQVLRTF